MTISAKQKAKYFSAMEARAKAIIELRKQQNNADTEGAHSAADDALCFLLTKLGYEDVVTEWSKVHKWYA